MLLAERSLRGLRLGQRCSGDLERQRWDTRESFDRRPHARRHSVRMEELGVGDVVCIQRQALCDMGLMVCSDGCVRVRVRANA